MSNRQPMYMNEIFPPLSGTLRPPSNGSENIGTSADTLFGVWCLQAHRRPCHVAFTKEEHAVQIDADRLSNRVQHPFHEARVIVAGAPGAFGVRTSADTECSAALIAA